MNNSDPNSKSTSQADDDSLDNLVPQYSDENISVQKRSGDAAQASSVSTESVEGDHVHRRRRHKLYQALARVAGTLEVKGDDLVIITEPDKAELVVVKVVGKDTAIRLLKLPDNRRRGTFSLYPDIKEGFRIVTFMTEVLEGQETEAPPNDQMFISGKLASVEDDGFYIDVDRNRRTIRAKQLVKMPLKIEGHEINPSWKIGQWLGLILHREGTKWVWRGETKEVLRANAWRGTKKEKASTPPDGAGAEQHSKD